MKRLIIFLIRRHLGLKKNEYFRFPDQKSDALYYFSETAVMKAIMDGMVIPSTVSLNWLLNPDCVIIRTGICR